MERASSRIESSNTEGPQISSPDPEERILARRFRIQKRNAASRKRLQAIEDGKEISSDEEETILEQQVEKSTIELITLAHEGKELITNVRVAADAHEVSRRAEQAAAKNERLRKLEEEANIAQQKFEKIHSKWEGISLLNDPLDLHNETELQREKCVDLIAQKDQLIADLKAELKAGDVRFVKDQQRQAEDISLLVERVDSQIAIMRRAYRRELILIEQAIDIERNETIELNNKRWESLYRQREEDEIGNLEKRFVALAEHNHLMQSIMVHHQEKFRATKISLEKDIQLLQQQLEQVKAICLLNKEKMDYNYQVLKKRDEESLLIRSQQKRRINKLQDIVTQLRRKIVDLEQSTQAEVKRLMSEVIKLHQNIKDIRLKADHFCSVNEKKYFQLWKFNHDSAKQLLDKILSIDRLIYEQHLGIEWQPELHSPITKNDLISYKNAVEKKRVNHKSKDSPRRSFSLGGEQLQHILEAIADRSGFLVEERLTTLLAPYTHSQKTLVRIDNVFNALGVTRQEDMQLLRQTMEPYLVCVTCQPLLETVHPISPPATPPPPPLSEEEFKLKVMLKVKETLEEGEKITAMKKEKAGSLQDELQYEPVKLSGETVEETSSVVMPLALSAHDFTTRSFFSVYPPQPCSSKSYSDIKGVGAPSECNMFSQRPLGGHPPEFSVTSTNAQSVSEHTITTCSQDGSEPEDSRSQGQLLEHDPKHTRAINPVLVLHALREFVQRFQEHTHRFQGPSWGDKVEENKSISRQISDADVKIYWEQFRAAFPREREKLWDCLYIGLQKYHSVLQERHNISSEIEHLKVQNADLRRLLQKYALPNNMKPSKGPRQNLPPLSVKNHSAPTLGPARLVLSFNSTSRL